MSSFSLLRIAPSHLALPGSILRVPVPDFDFTELAPDLIKATIRELFLTLYSEEGGVGLAAPMVGLHLRLAIVDPGDAPMVLFNPSIVSMSHTLVDMREANLCMPGYAAQVNRAETITFRAFDHRGVQFEQTVSGLLARIVLHELDILDGRMFCDFVPTSALIHVSANTLSERALQRLLNAPDSSGGETKGGPSMHYLSVATLSPKFLGLQHSVLRRKCLPVDFAEWNPEQLREIVGELLWLQHHLEGVGLAAPQVGLSVRLAVIDDGNNAPIVLINPIIVKRSSETERGYEACLSIPGYRAMVERAKRVTVEALDITGKSFELSAEDYLARIIQHEVDHLDGILFTDHLLSTEELEAIDPDTLADRALRSLYGEQEEGELR